MKDITQPDKINLFTPVGKLFTPVEQVPSPTVPSPLREPAEVALSQTPEFIRQVAEPGGIHSCFPTAFFNASIQKGILTTREAQQAQDFLITQRSGWFSSEPFQLGSQTVRTFNANPLRLAEMLKEQSGKEVHISVHKVADVNDVPSFIQTQLRMGHPLIGGSSTHAYTVTKEAEMPDSLIVIDPLEPDVPKTMNLQAFSELTKQDGWLTVIED